MQRGNVNNVANVKNSFQKPSKSDKIKISEMKDAKALSALKQQNCDQVTSILNKLIK